MKKVSLIIISILLVIGLIGCIPKLPWDISETKLTITDRKVRLVLEPGLTSASGATLTIRNGGTTAIMLGNAYEVETRYNNVWYHIDVTGQKWSAQKALIEAGKSKMVEIHWDDIYGTLPKGKYRLVVPYKEGSTDYYAAVEFNIN